MKRPIIIELAAVVLLISAVAMAQTASAPVCGQQSADTETKSPSDQQHTGVDATQQKKPEPKLPDAPSVRAPLTPHQKFNIFIKRTYSPYTFASAAFGATWAQMWGTWPSYGGGMEGWGKRFGATMANTEGRMMFSSFLLPVIFHQDPRDFPSRAHGFFPRAWYASTRVFVGRSDDGKSMFNYSEVLGVLFTSSLQNSYYPTQDRGFPETLNRFVGGISSDASAAMLKEFSPEIKRTLRKIIPKRAQQLEKKIPEPVRKSIPTI